MVDFTATTSRWVQPFDFEPGHWKKQLPTKYLNLAIRGDLAKIQDVVEREPETLNKRGPHGRTFLFEAVRKGREDVVRWLVDQGADIGLTGCYNSETFVQLNPLTASRYYGRPAIEKLLIANGATNDVFRSAFCGDIDYVKQELKRSPELLNVEDPYDEIYFTPLLSFFVSGNHADGAHWMVEQGAEVTLYSTQLLFLAAHNDNAALVEFLLNRGAELQSADSSLWMSTNNIDILHLFLKYGLSANQLPYHGLSPLMYACRADKSENIAKVKLLLRHRARVNELGPNDRTALHYAAQIKSPEIAELLLRAGADASLRDDKGQTPTDIAIKKRNAPMVTLIRSFT